MGWTIEYIRNMDHDDFLRMCEVLRGMETAREHERIRATERAG